MVDAELSETSTNPIQNKTVNSFVTFFTTTMDEQIEQLQNKDTEHDSAIAACVKTADLVAITNEEIDAMFLRGKKHKKEKERVSTDVSLLFCYWRFSPFVIFITSDS